MEIILPSRWRLKVTVFIVSCMIIMLVSTYEAWWLAQNSPYPRSPDIMQSVGIMAVLALATGISAIMAICYLKNPAILADQAR